jgi:hypothetical protein
MSAGPVETPADRLDLAGDGVRATLWTPDGGHLLTLWLLSGHTRLEGRFGASTVVITPRVRDRARDALRQSVAQMLGPDERPRMGIALLHHLLRIVYLAAKEARPDTLVITQSPHPSFADVTDMVRLKAT